MWFRRFSLALSLCVALAFSHVSWAGSQQGGEAHFSVEQIAGLAKKVENTLAAKGARVFLIGRSGRPAEELPPGVHYTHVGFGVYSQIQKEDGSTVAGYALYNLYQQEDNLAKGELVTNYMMDFLSESYQPRVGIIIPTPELQQRLLGFIATAEYESLLNTEYSVMANPYNRQYQNCTEYILDVINAAIYKTVDKQELKLLAKEYFQAQDIHVSPFKTLFGELFVAGVRKDDHVGQIKTATYTTIAAYLESFNLTQEIMTIEM